MIFLVAILFAGGLGLCTLSGLLLAEGEIVPVLMALVLLIAGFFALYFSFSMMTP